MAIDYKDIGQRIKAKRIENGLTQEKLSLTAMGLGDIMKLSNKTKGEYPYECNCRTDHRYPAYRSAHQ